MKISFSAQVVTGVLWLAASGCSILGVAVSSTSRTVIVPCLCQSYRNVFSTLLKLPDFFYNVGQDCLQSVICQHQLPYNRWMLHSYGSVSVSELLEWFWYTVNVIIFLHCVLRLHQQGFVCQQVFIFLIWHDISVCPVRVCVFILDSSNHYVCHKHSQQQLSDSVFNLVSSSTFHSVHVLNSLGVFSIYCQSYIDGSMSVSQITGMVSVHC